MTESHHRASEGIPERQAQEAAGEDLEWHGLFWFGGGKHRSFRGNSKKRVSLLLLSPCAHRFSPHPLNLAVEIQLKPPLAAALGLQEQKFYLITA